MQRLCQLNFSFVPNKKLLFFKCGRNKKDLQKIMFLRFQTIVSIFLWWKVGKHSEDFNVNLKCSKQTNNFWCQRSLNVFFVYVSCATFRMTDLNPNKCLWKLVDATWRSTTANSSLTNVQIHNWLTAGIS